MNKTENPYQKAVSASLAAEKRAREHDVTIYARGCETTRECYCRNTNGFSHHEDESPWVVNMEGRFERGGYEQPLEHPFRSKDEDLDEYHERLSKAAAWDEGAEAQASQYETGQPHRLSNPYLEV